MGFKKTYVIIPAFFTLIFILSACGGSSARSDESGSTGAVYLKNNIHAHEKPGRAGAVVYWASYANYIGRDAGHFIVPVNTRVVIGPWKRGFSMTDQAEGRVIYFEFNSRNMRMSADEYLQLITSPTEVSLSGLSEIDLKGIQDGRAYKNMSKRGVRMALGYPAVHQTPSLKDLSWTYWKNSRTMIIVDFFGDGAVRRLR
ncbi:MAG: hypothetical protein GY849_22280 [Deltaproteobacteria bacterium]|nr:hypothetical protein [Deltaproteobacteria bacterium]